MRDARLHSDEVLTECRKAGGTVEQTLDVIPGTPIGVLICVGRPLLGDEFRRPHPDDRGREKQAAEKQRCAEGRSCRPLPDFQRAVHFDPGDFAHFRPGRRPS